MGAEVRVEHAYPAAMDFLRRHGPETLAVLHDLLAQAERRDGELVVRASVRDIAGRLGFISKDTVHRRLRQLVRAGVLRRSASAGRAGSMSSVFEIELAGTSISVTAFGAAPTSGRPGPTPAPTSTPPLPTPTSPPSSPLPPPPLPPPPPPTPRPPPPPPIPPAPPPRPLRPAPLLPLSLLPSHPLTDECTVVPSAPALRFPLRIPRSS